MQSLWQYHCYDVTKSPMRNKPSEVTELLVRNKSLSVTECACHSAPHGLTQTPPKCNMILKTTTTASPRSTSGAAETFNVYVCMMFVFYGHHQRTPLGGTLGSVLRENYLIYINVRLIYTYQMSHELSQKAMGKRVGGKERHVGAARHLSACL